MRLLLGLPGPDASQGKKGRPPLESSKEESSPGEEVLGKGSFLLLKHISLESCGASMVPGTGQYTRRLQLHLLSGGLASHPPTLLSPAINE